MIREASSPVDWVLIMSASLCCGRRPAERKQNHKFTQTVRQGECYLNVLCFTASLFLRAGHIFSRLGVISGLKSESKVTRHGLINICSREIAVGSWWEVNFCVLKTFHDIKAECRTDRFYGPG